MKYFAYGTNMSLSQLISRCPSAKKLLNATLNNYQFIFNSRGVATIISKRNSTVYGVLFEIDDSEIDNLDRHEGVPKLYTKENKKIEFDNGEEFEALVYVATDSEIGKPRDEHLNIILNALNKEQFPEQYIRNLKEKYD